ncbi:MAG TPA: hypothetical protein VHA73_12650, partial [Acidimicrobiales bacterium]|nr:hypothetical protein [Acidimicrobiales bacterium]
MAVGGVVGGSGRGVLWRWNPLVNKITDSTWNDDAVSTTVDLLGRPVSYTDIWGNTTTTSYDQAGRVTATSGPEGPMTFGYDSSNGRATTTSDFGATLATSIYDTPTGRLAGVSYSTGLGTLLGYDADGRSNATVTIDPNSNVVSEDVVARSPAGRVVDESFLGASGMYDPTPTGNDYSYDGAGRLTQAAVPGVTFNYGYGTTSGCAADTAGANTNRTSLVITGVGASTTNYCY